MIEKEQNSFDHRFKMNDFIYKYLDFFFSFIFVVTGSADCGVFFIAVLTANFSPIFTIPVLS